MSEEYLARAAFAAGQPLAFDASAGAGDDFNIQWMPPGPQKPKCKVGGKAKELSFTVMARHAIAFNDQLQARRALAAAGQGDEPFIDFNHEDGRAAGRPTEFYWGGDDPQQGGIRVKGKWTPAGKSAVQGKEFTRFSPEWHFNASHEPIGVGVNLGGLVNRAAFQSIASVKAGAATQENETMTTEEIKQAIAEGMKPISDRLAALETARGKDANEDTLTKAIATAMEPITTELKTIKEGRDNDRKAQAKAAVSRFVGRIGLAPQDAKAIEFYEKSWLADASTTEEVLGKLPARAGAGRLTTSNAGTATATASGVEPEEIYEAKAKTYATEHKLDEVEGLIAFGRTAEGSALQEQFREKVRAA